MPSTSQRYPLSTPDGIAIPLEIIRPYSFIRKSFLASGATGNIAVPSNIEIMSITSTEDCIIKFGGTASVPADGVELTSALLLEKYTRVCLAPTASTFTVIGLTLDGILNIQFLDKWAGLALQTQYQKR